MNHRLTTSSNDRALVWLATANASSRSISACNRAACRSVSVQRLLVAGFFTLKEVIDCQVAVGCEIPLGISLDTLQPPTPSVNI